MYDKTFMDRAIEISADALTTPGVQPFGAVVVKDGRIVGEGVNRSVMIHDPTSHGETEAIRAACKALGTVDLRGAALYSSCEPCPMCAAVMMIAGVSELYYGVDMGHAGQLTADVPPSARFPVDVPRIKAECGLQALERSMTTEQHEEARATQVMRDWVAHVTGSTGA